jgi:hypothetical protein
LLNALFRPRIPQRRANLSQWPAGNLKIGDGPARTSVHALRISQPDSNALHARLAAFLERLCGLSTPFAGRTCSPALFLNRHVLFMF